MTAMTSIYKKAMSSRLFKSSFWGIAANAVQSILLSLFFIIMARQYNNDEFAVYLIANTIYLFLSAFSTLGLGQWFTREVVKTDDTSSLVNKFLKMQIISGIFFYGVNIIAAYTLYDEGIIQKLSLILGINIIFDNVIYAIRALNVAEFKQQKSFVVMLIDSVLKFLAGCSLFLFPISILYLSVVLICIRFVTLNLFLNLGSSNTINLGQLWKYKLPFSEVKKIVAPNWAFIIIGSVAMIYWRIGNIIISKMLTLFDVSNYEVSYRLFSLALILPSIISNTVFPSLVEMHKNGSKKEFSQYFHKVFIIYLLYSLLTYTFIYSFADYIIPFAFGEKYTSNPSFTKEMFLSILVFPTALLQANMMVALHKEKADMWLNIISLIVNVAFCFIGLAFYKSLSVINYSIFVSFFVFHICQDILLVKYQVSDAKTVIGFYLLVALVAGTYVFSSAYFNPILFFILFWIIVGGIGVYFVIRSGIFKKVPKPIKLELEKSVT